MRVHEGRQLCELAQPHPLQTLGKNEQALVGHFDHLMHHRRSSHRIEIAGLWRVDPRLALGHDNDGLVFPERIDKLNGTFPTHGQRQNRVREQYGVPYREYRKSLLFVYFLILRSALDGRLLAHYVSLSVTRSSLDVTLSRKVSEARK